MLQQYNLWDLPEHFGLIDFLNVQRVPKVSKVLAFQTAFPGGCLELSCSGRLTAGVLQAVHTDAVKKGRGALNHQQKVISTLLGRGLIDDTPSSINL